MAHSLSAKKRIRQNITRRDRNRARKSALKKEIRRFADAVHDKNVDAARDQLRTVTRRIDQIAAKGTIHKNAAARRKSRLARRLNKLATST